MTGGEDLLRAVEAKAALLRDALCAKVEANLSGDVLQSRTGALKASIIADLATEANAVIVSIASSGVAYAAIQEYGGRTPPHEIMPVKARALAFAGVGGAVFARRVRHPGSTIPARAPFGGALDALRADILEGTKGVVRAALGIT